MEKKFKYNRRQDGNLSQQSDKWKKPGTSTNPRSRNPNLPTKHERLKNNVQRPGFQNKNKSSFQKAMMDFKDKQQRKADAKVEKARQRQEKLSALEQYKKRKQQRSAILGKKTKKGQPVMKDRMDMLLQKIQRTIAEETKQ